MRGSRREHGQLVDHGGLRLDGDVDGFAIRQAEWGDTNVAVEQFAAGMHTEPIVKGLPNDRCQCRPWGSVLRGRVRIRYADHEEVVSAGDVCYLAPGYVTLCEEDTELVELSRKGEHQKTIEVAWRNVAALQAPRG